MPVDINEAIDIAFSAPTESPKLDIEKTNRIVAHYMNIGDGHWPDHKYLIQIVAPLSLMHKTVRFKLGEVVGDLDNKDFLKAAVLDWYREALKSSFGLMTPVNSDGIQGIHLARIKELEENDLRWMLDITDVELVHCNLKPTLPTQAAHVLVESAERWDF